MWSAMMMHRDNHDGHPRRADIDNHRPWSTIVNDDDINDDTTSSPRDASNQPLIQEKIRDGRDHVTKKANNNLLIKLRTALTTADNTNNHHHHHPFRAATDPSSPTNIYLLGERNSGTNYAASILKKAFIPPNHMDPSRLHEAFSSDIPILRHKHMFRHTLLNETELNEISRRTDILWILVVRRPCDWADAMKRLPWHMCNTTNIASDCPGTKLVRFEHSKTLTKYSFAEFMELEWGDWPESSNFRNLSFVSKDFVYRNVFELRRHKLQLMKQIVDMVPRNIKIVRLHELELSPELFLQNLITEFNLSRLLRKNYRPQQPSAKQHREKCLSEQEWEIAQREIDWEMEANFGYTFLDCHRCYDEQ
ncbi:hypothetical protein ACHAXH_006950 [Discostella pseudostelligera]